MNLQTIPECRIRVFNEPQDPFIDSEFVQMLGNYLSLNQKYSVPTIGKRTFFWSTRHYPDVPKQYLVDFSINNPQKYYYFKEACAYIETVRNYSKGFKVNLRKAEKNGCTYELLHSPDEETILRCYKIYNENMSRKHTYSFDFDFFRSVVIISYAFLLLVKIDEKIVSFGLQLGNLGFIQSSTEQGRKLGANYFLYDRCFHKFEYQVFFAGIASTNNHGLLRFKERAGLTGVPAASVPPDLTHAIIEPFRHSRFAGFILRLLNKRKLLGLALPY
ncbi:MAG: hypothetical protein R3F50_05360 [Gammaproteobacteria bacterium]|jgi:hypothetical protein